MNARAIASIMCVTSVTLIACQAEVRPASLPYHERAEVAAFIDEMVDGHGFARDEINALIAGVTPQTRVLELVSTPAEAAKPWRDYRPIFVNAQRIEEGVRFWREQREWLERASEKYAVDPEIIVAIIGVETFYGRNQGRYPVLDSLVTLGFDYPPRASFFRTELREFLLLTREEGLEPRGLVGSYAGAMGRGQFISSSYRNYAVDFDGDGRRDLVGSWPDVLGSVASYFARHGWRRGETAAIRAGVEGDGWQRLVGDIKPAHTPDVILAAGVRPEAGLARDRLYAFIMLDGAEGVEHWVVADNFYVITRYNRSPMYAMAVWQLAHEIRAALGEASR